MPHADFSEPVPWGTEIKDLDGLRNWLKIKFNEDVWPRMRKEWFKQSGNDIFESEQPKIHSMQAILGSQELEICEKNNWINPEIRQRMRVRNEVLRYFIFVLVNE